MNRVDDKVAIVTGGGSGGGFFLGMISDTPIAWAITDRGGSTEVLESFLFTPVPEPTTILPVAVGAAALLRRRTYVRIATPNHPRRRCVLL